MRKMIAVSNEVAQQAATAVLCREVVTSASKYNAMLRWPPLAAEFQKCCLGFVMFMQFYNRPPNTIEDWKEVKRLQTDIKNKLYNGSPCMPLEYQNRYKISEVFINKVNFKSGDTQADYLKYIGVLLDNPLIILRGQNGFCDFYFTILITSSDHKGVVITEFIPHVMKLKFTMSDPMCIFDLSFREDTGEVARENLDQEVWDRIKFYMGHYSQNYIDNGFSIETCLVRNIYAVYYTPEPRVGAALG
ncbi:hypothetical protein HOG75_00870, partial [bacterium]|nr:hypothetical protein [bacterium]